MFLEIVSKLISTFAYDYLRTERMLGYIVSCSAFEIGRSAYLYVVVQGNKESPELMDNDIEFMLQEFRKEILLAFTEKDFQGMKKNILAQILIEDDSFYERTARIWKEIVDRDKDFDIQEKLVNQLGEATFKELLEFYDTKIVPKDRSTLKKLSVQFYSKLKYPELPSKFNNTVTPYKGINHINENLIEHDL